MQAEKQYSKMMNFLIAAEHLLVENGDHGDEAILSREPKRKVCDSEYLEKFVKNGDDDDKAILSKEPKFKVCDKQNKTSVLLTQCINDIIFL